MTAPSLLELPLDDELLKVLASDTRRDILRLLLERRMTGTELANRLGLGKPAISEHLKKLSDTDLVVRHDDPERRWVYYTLSTRGKSLLEPQKVRFYLVLGVACVSLVVGVVLALSAMWLQGALVPAPHGEAAVWEGGDPALVGGPLAGGPLV
ncbi:MAG TPA: winged helix-turn-helix domain-containing protein, partial [Candidatus Thermoplasmatota archaeon]|nr:winged helix-turn-helix domain-containing protein [Candidatus Thermoplasmatota archaeon]